MKENITVKDVAKTAGVSTATVSRVINNKEKVKLITRTKVEEAMKSLDYHPNSIAKNFASQKTNRIALIVDIENEAAFANPFFYQIQFGIEKYLAKNGYSLSIYNKNNQNDESGLIDRLVFQKQVDGVILHSMLLNRKLVSSLKKSGLPFICIGEPSENFEVDWVDIDNQQAGQLAAEFLIDDGYKNILVISMGEKDLFNKRRLEGISKAFKKSQKAIEYKSLVLENQSFEEAYNIIESFFNSNLNIDAIISINNIYALAAELAAQKLRMKIPEDVGIITFDRYPVVELSMPQLTTVDIDVLSLGNSAAVMLLRNLELKSTVTTNMNLSVQVSPRKTTRNIK
jgi:DNA-binding LacI/PurR family transcriptional regulator